MIWRAKGIDFYPSNPSQASVWKEKGKGSTLYPPMPFPSRSNTPLAFMRALYVLACPSRSRAPLELSTPFSFSRALCIHARARFSPSFLSSARRYSKVVCSGRGHHFSTTHKKNLETPPFPSPSPPCHPRRQSSIRHDLSMLITFSNPAFLSFLGC